MCIKIIETKMKNAISNDSVGTINHTQPRNGSICAKAVQNYPYVLAYGYKISTPLKERM